MVFTGGGDDVGDEAAVAGAVFAEGDGGVGDGGVLAQDGFDFAGFDAVAAELDLVVDASEEFEVAVGAVADEVAGAVEALRRVVEGVGDEAFGGEFGAVEIAAGEAGAADVELAGGRRWGPVGGSDRARTAAYSRSADQSGACARRRRGPPGQCSRRPCSRSVRSS